MDKSQTFNILEVNNIKTNKLDYSYSNNIININRNNSKTIVLDNSYSNYYLVTQDSNMDIILYLSSQKIGTKFRILITNVQKSLKIVCVNIYDKFKGTLKISNNSGNINEEVLNNNLKKNITQTIENFSDIIYIPSTKLGLYNGGYIDLLYSGNIYCNKSVNTEIGYWLVNSELIGDINLPKNIYLETGNNNYLLTIYISINTNKIICVTSKNILTNKIYFNSVNNNNIVIFLNLSYDIHIITIDNNTKIYDSNIYNSSNVGYKLEICDNLLRTNNAEDDNFIHLKDLNTESTTHNKLEFIKEFVNEKEKYNIQETYNTTILNYDNLNVIKYRIKDLSNASIIEGFFNIISIKSYNNDNKTDNNLSSLLFGYNNIFTEEKNKIILDESKY
tara:strand:- start:33 stop:1202 length:1170 start_codon:yes stop_codon:yes gene_type:complete